MPIAMGGIQTPKVALPVPNAPDDLDPAMRYQWNWHWSGSGFRGNRCVTFTRSGS
jgi:hypothetical protein